MNQIRKARLLVGYTQGELAEKLSVSPVTVCKWENGKTFPSVKRLKHVAEVLQITVNELIEKDVV